MEVLDIIRSRRSVRQYLKETPSDELIMKVIEAGRWAPSGLNNQPWRFLIIKDKKTKDKIATFTKYSRIIKGAPIIICVFLDYASSYNKEKDIMAVGACIQNMLLCAHQQGIGSCWLGEILNRKEEVSRALQADSDYELMALITLGYPDEQKSKSSRKSVKSLIIKEI